MHLADTLRSAAPGRVSVHRRRVALVGCAAAVIAMYLMIGLQYGRSLAPTAKQGDFHNLVADALEHGHARLMLEPPAGLGDLPDPYDATANMKFRYLGYHDLSYYHGALYSYFGPTPALSFVLPFRLLGLGDAPPALATLVFLAVGYLFTVLTYLRLARLLPRPPGLLLDCAALLLLGSATTAPFIMHTGRAYEEAIAAGTCFVVAGLYFLTRAFTTTRHRTAWCALASAALGVSVGARPDDVIYAGLVVVAALVVLARGTNRVRTVLALLAPVVVCGILLAAFNYVRFHSVAEFGGSYQLAGMNMQTYPFRQAWYLPVGLYYYLLAAPQISLDFPYFRLLQTTLFGNYPTLYSYEPVAGLFLSAPVVPIGLASFVAAGPRLMRRAPVLYAGLALATVSALAVLVFVAWQFSSATQRYEFDFAPVLVLVAALGFGALCGQLDARLRRILIAVWIIAAILSIAVSLATAWIPCGTTGSC